MSRRLGIVVTACLAGLGAAPALDAAEPAAAVRATRVLVVYHSVSGHTRAMAEAVAAGAGSVPGSEVTLRAVAEATTEELLAADAIILGSPVHSANIAPPMLEFIDRWPFEGQPMRDKLGAAFATGGGISAGEEAVQLALLRAMLVFGMVVVGGPDWTGAFGASAVTEEPPFGPTDEPVEERFLAKGRALGQRVGELATRWRAGARDAEAEP